MEKDTLIYGEKVIVSLLRRQNIQTYLSVYKRASAFSEAYNMMPDVWKKTRERIENDVFEGNKARYLIIEKATSQGCGYLELNYDNSEMPEADIAILEECRRKGYAYEAAKILFENILKQDFIKCIVWIAFASNQASRRIAEKLGGVVVERENLIVEAMRAAGLKMDSIDNERIPETVTYEIKIKK